ncbi:acyltransferase family protein [Plantibacter sp. CFBP 8804]|uniref:acyltransferase family protein n=1 Tax=Plantibacter sp. CFBP 8804 TaxID=2775270 RepID=UPI00177C6919|nr:acyltransferase [Plantibacter sp. CFBP 8804]
MSFAGTHTARKIEFLEAVRGIAAAVVVVQHVLAADIPGYAEISNQYLDLGRVGVVAFFLVSGYVIPMSLQSQSLKVFLTRRFFRLYPVYWIALAIYCLININAGVFADENLMTVMANIFMIQGLLGLASILPPAWTLSIELLFYGQAVGAQIMNRLRLIALSGWCWLALYLILCLAARLLNRDMPVTFALLLFVAAVGNSVYRRDQGTTSLLVPYLIAAAVVIPVGSVLSVDGEWPPFTYTISTFAGFALFFAMYAIRNRQFSSVVIKLGAISYAVYIFHPIIADLIQILPAISGWLAVGLNFVLVLVVGLAVHRYVELPFIGLGRRISKSYRGPDDKPTDPKSPATSRV